MRRRTSRRGGATTPRVEPPTCPFCQQSDRAAHFINAQWFCKRCAREFTGRRFRDGDPIIAYEEVRWRVDAGTCPGLYDPTVNPALAPHANCRCTTAPTEGEDA